MSFNSLKPIRGLDALLESSNNLSSLELVEKFGLTKKPHPYPYYIQWINSYDKIKVTKIRRIEFLLGSNMDIVDFDIVPMQACQLLLGKAWISENNIVHNTIANKYSFKYNGRKFTLVPITAAEILREDLMRSERRNNEPLEKNGLFQMLQYLLLNLIFYKMKILLCLMLELIFCITYPKKRIRR